VTAALQAMPRLGADAALCRAVDAFAERYVGARRAPADDLFDAPRLLREDHR
jgi:glutamate--cysteine ligase